MKHGIKGSNSSSNKKAKIKKNSAPSSNDKSKAMFDWGEDDDDIASHSDSSMDEENAAAGGATSSEDEESLKESAHDKRLRLAKEYLGKLHEENEKNSDSEEEASPSGVVGEDPIAARLAREAREAAGKIFHAVADKLTSFEFDQDSSKSFRGHRLSVTAVTLLPNSNYIAYSASKDGSIYQWTLPSGKKQKLQDDTDNDLPTSKRAVLALASSSNGKFVVSAGRDSMVRVWNAPAEDDDTTTLAETFSGHRDTISSLAFRQNSLALFSGSHDRTIKHWNLKEMGYVETLFGHQNEINAVASLRNERVVSSGADKSVRLWKIPEETQLVFNGSGEASSYDCIVMVNEQYYVTGADDGSLTLWFTGRKKPVFQIHNAHRNDDSSNNTMSMWISSLAMLPDSDLLASGSCDGQIRLWKVDVGSRSIEQVASVPAIGFVNALSFSKNGEFLVAGIGQEHRLGRWQRIKAAKNGILVTALPDLGL